MIIMKIYNTLTNKIEDFIPHTPGEIKMYTCGPTVYHYAHLGNIRTYIMEDVFEKTFNYLGYKVKRVMNITDVGHLESDGDTGEDKMLVAAERENKTSQEIADYYTEAFFEDCGLVNIKKTETIVPATKMITAYIKIIEDLLAKDFAYQAEGNIYFDTAKFANYYELSGRKAEELMIAVRDSIEEDKSKRNPFDFGLWFTNSKFDNQELKWDSPWGIGYPGWHIECSAIAITYLGEYLDLHFGAEDAVFPHHSNEIAQSEAYLGHKWCNYWVHLSFLNIDNAKMSKSKGDSLRIKNLQEKGYDPLSYRYFVLNTHYHRQVNFSFASLDSAQSAYLKLHKKTSELKDEGQFNEEQFSAYDELFKAALENDLNTANAVTLVHTLLKDDKVNATTKNRLITKWDEVLSLDLKIIKKAELTISPEYIDEMISKRNEAKKNKNFGEADRIRQELLDQNIELEDTREGTTYKVGGLK